MIRRFAGCAYVIAVVFSIACGGDSGGAVDAESFCIENCENWESCHGEELKTQAQCESDCERDFIPFQRTDDERCIEALEDTMDCVLNLSCDQMLNVESNCRQELERLDNRCEG